MDQLWENIDKLGVIGIFAITVIYLLVKYSPIVNNKTKSDNRYITVGTCEANIKTLHAKIDPIKEDVKFIKTEQYKHGNKLTQIETLIKNR